MDKVKRIRKAGAFDVVNIVVLTIFSLLCLFPLLNVLLTSFSTHVDYVQSVLFVIPKHFNIESYKLILFEDRIGTAFLISLGVTVFGTAFQLVMTTLGAYALTKERLPGRKLLFAFILVTMFFSGGLIPLFLTVQGLGLMNTLFSLVLPFSINTFNMIILRNFFSQVPEGIVESAKMDGAGEFTVLFRFVVPLSMAGLATVMLFYLVERWNDWYWPMIFLTDDSLYPLAYELRNVLANTQSMGYGDGSGSIDGSKIYAEGKEAAMVIISLLPIVAVYPFIQKNFVKGVMIGGIKG